MPVLHVWAPCLRAGVVLCPTPVPVFTTVLYVSHQSVAKLEYVLLRTFRTLIGQGYCGPSEERGDGAEGPMQDNVDGTGMGSGQGAARRGVAHC